jgi:hypothetical protein
MSKVKFPMNPWADGPCNGDLWIPQVDKARIDRENLRMMEDDPRRVHYTTPKGKPYLPAGWSGNPWKAPILLLLLNPAYSESPDVVYEDPEAYERARNAVIGNWDAKYPNPYLHPKLRSLDSWCAKVPCSGLHKHLVESGMEEEAAWQRVSQKIALVELSPWASYRWSPAAFVETTKVSVELARLAMEDTDRIVLLGRGESDWKSAGLLDVDTLSASKGVRMHQSRITKGNFPTVWDRLTAEVEKP